MNRILVANDGGAPTLNFIRSLRAAPVRRHLIGMGANPYDLCKSEADETHLVPWCWEDDYLDLLRDLVRRTRPDFLHSQNDSEIKMISDHRDELGVRTFMPHPETVAICVNKWRSYEAWSRAGLTVPRTRRISDEADMKTALAEFGPKVWLRAWEGGFGFGAVATDHLEFACRWIERYDGWGKFTAAECLTESSVTWTSLWRDGRLIVAQGRRRLYWEFANRNLSGVTGITGTGVTVSDSTVDTIARQAILAIDVKPQGLFSVDLTYDAAGVPNPTEINIGRLFTTHEFFTQAGLNIPDLYVRCALGEDLPELPVTINPLPPGLAWVRGMDSRPVLTTLDTIQSRKDDLAARRKNLRPTTRA